MAFCTECGKELHDGLRFCAECGTAAAAESQPAEKPSIATSVKDVAEAAAEAIIPELPSTGGVVEVLAPAEVGKVTLSTWKSTPPAAQAVGAAVGQAQKAAKTAKNSPVAKKSKLPVVLVAVGAAILVAAFALYVVPLFRPHPYDPNSHVALTSSSSSSASGSSTSSTSSSEEARGLRARLRTAAHRRRLARRLPAHQRLRVPPHRAARLRQQDRTPPTSAPR